MKYQLIYFLTIITLTTFSCQQSGTNEGKTLNFTNSSKEARKDVLVRIEAEKAKSVFGENILADLHFSVPHQLNDNNLDGLADEILLLLDFEAGESKDITALLSETAQSFPKRTQAEISHKINGKWQKKDDDTDRNEYIGEDWQNVDRLKVPVEHSDHSWYIRYEGPGWESDKVGYRFYLDWRNATDIFGKKTRDMVLQNVGLDGFDSYHEASDWGMDILKVGNSLGIGAFGMWLDGKANRVAETDNLETAIVANGIIQSQIRTFYNGWAINDQKIDLTSDISIHAGSRLTHQQLTLSEAAPNLCTGIVKAQNTELMTNREGTWGYIATFGQQSLAEDNLGMVVFFKNVDVAEITEDEFSHIVVLQPKNQKVEYYYAACWEQEPNGITTKEAFVDYINAIIKDLNQPIKSK